MSKSFLLIASIVVLLLVVIVFNFLNTTRLYKANSGIWKEVDVGRFYISLPISWKYEEQQGFDSFVGKFTGDNTKLSFDYGWHSYPLDKEREPEYIITYETIGGMKAKIVTPANSGKGTTGVYFENTILNEPNISPDSEPFFVGNQINKLTIHGENLNEKQKETVLKIFRSVKFKQL